MNKNQKNKLVTIAVLSPLIIMFFNVALFIIWQIDLPWKVTKWSGLYVHGLGFFIVHFTLTLYCIYKYPTKNFYKTLFAAVVIVLGLMLGFCYDLFMAFGWYINNPRL
tara:strand:+ start:731 stop:1054 length:324 start_codon:yes stop_codon:yes gene_type:complete